MPARPSAPIAITGTGLVTGVGLTAAASCAAIRGAIDNFRETRFRDGDGAWIVGSEVQLGEPWRGETKLRKMTAAAIAECLAADPAINPRATPLLLCLAEPRRPGRMPADDARFLDDLQQELGVVFHAQSRVGAAGRVSIALAIRHARGLIREKLAGRVLVAAADSLLTGPTVGHYEAAGRLLSSTSSDGFVPGEAAGVLALGAPERRGGPQLVCRGVGFGAERAHVDSGEPLRGDGLALAMKEALADAGCGESALEFKIIDASGEQYRFKEASLAFSRLDRTRRTEFDVWHPADCIGEVGAAIGPAMVAVLKASFEKGYARGRHVLMHLGDDDGRRGALVFSWGAAEG